MLIHKLRWEAPSAWKLQTLIMLNGFKNKATGILRTEMGKWKCSTGFHVFISPVNNICFNCLFLTPPPPPPIPCTGCVFIYEGLVFITIPISCYTPAAAAAVLPQLPTIHTMTAKIYIYATYHHIQKWQHIIKVSYFNINSFQFCQDSGLKKILNNIFLCVYGKSSFRVKKHVSSGKAEG